MLIDWFTVIAQLINFLILVFLLHRFLYKPITKTIRTRQNQLEKRWREAEQQKNAAEAKAVAYEQKQQELRQNREEILAKAREEGEQEYHNLIQQARQEVEEKQAGWEEAIAQQQEQFFDDLQQRVTEQVYQIARRAFQELADVELEQQAIATFIHRLENLDQQERESLTQSLQKTDKGLLIRSSFNLSVENRHKILNSLQQQQIYQDDNLRFATAEDLICGIELQASDYKVAWNLQNYLESLDKYLANSFPQASND